MARDSNWKDALWVVRISTKESISTSPFLLVYGTYVVFPIQLGVPVMKFLQNAVEEPNGIQRRIYQLVEVQQTIATKSRLCLIRKPRKIIFHLGILF